MIRRLEHLCSGGSLGQLGLFSPEMKKLLEETFSVPERGR